MDEGEPVRWQQQAKCRGLDAALFIPERGFRPEGALNVCNGLDGNPPCSVREECSAARTPDDTGVWGGKFYGSKSVRRRSVLDRMGDARPRRVS